MTAALVPTLALGGIGLGAAVTTVLATATVAAADQSGPWSTPTALTGTGHDVSVHDVVTTKDGTAAAVWRRQIAGTGQLELWVATRPASSTVWGTPKLLESLPTNVHESVALAPAADGSVTVAWVSMKADRTSTLRTATLAKGATTWSTPATVATAPVRINYVSLTSGQSGKTVLGWTESAAYGFLVERTGVGAWSTAEAILPSGYGMQVGLAPDGTTTVVWEEQTAGGSNVVVMDRAPGDEEWSQPQVISPQDRGGTPELTIGADGTVAVVWVSTLYPPDPSAEPDIDLVTAVRPGGSAVWAAPLVRETNGHVTTRQPLIGPTGEVTIVWREDVDPGTAYYPAVRTSSRTVDGTWSPVRDVSTAKMVTDQFDAATGADGNIQIGWDQLVNDTQTSFHTSARINGTWTPVTKLSTVPTYGSNGRVAVAPDGDATAVWGQGKQLWTAGTGLTAPPVPAKHRDYVGKDGFPDLYAQTAAGALYVYQGNANHTVSANVSGGTWPTTSFVAPFGDLNGDGCNDTLVRTSAGELYRYNPACGTPVTPAAPRTLIGGSGWNGFDALTYSGDFNADRLPDLVARQISTGDLYLFAGTQSGGLTRVGKVGSGWKSLTIVGTGDLNGDKNADLIARTSTGYLYRYLGTGRGTIGSGVKIGSGWGGMVNMIGIGDLTGDGKNDIVGRTTAGDLHRYAGTGTGAIGSGVKIGTGWKSFASIK
ncbi:VCBS repeat-containing protein [Streptomyces sp.]|uniref:FG-GAP repeat domain-containing protein n=1 Tax=Streptomyces sp. TaxID=1931 RepID=UPI002F93B9E7